MADVLPTNPPRDGFPGLESADPPLQLDDATQNPDGTVELAAPEALVMDEAAVAAAEGGAPQGSAATRGVADDDDDADSDQEFVLKTNSSIAHAPWRESTLNNKEMRERLKSPNTTWSRQAWSRLQQQMQEDDSNPAKPREGKIGAAHFNRRSLNIYKEDPSVEVVVAALKRYLDDFEGTPRLLILRLLNYATEAFFSNLYKDMSAEVVNSIKELSVTVTRVGIQYGSRGGPIRKQVLGMIQSTSIFSGSETFNSVLGTIREFIAVNDKTLRDDLEHANSLAISMAMFTLLLSRSRMKDEKVGKAVRLIMRKTKWPGLRNEACFCAAELVRTHVHGASDLETLDRIIQLITTKDKEDSVGVAYLAAIFAPYIKPSPLAGSFRTACVEHLADAAEPTEQMLYGLAIARIALAKSQTLWEKHLARSAAMDARNNANMSRSLFHDEEEGTYNYETIAINLDDEDKEAFEIGEEEGGDGAAATWDGENTRESTAGASSVGDATEEDGDSGEDTGTVGNDSMTERTLSMSEHSRSSTPGLSSSIRSASEYNTSATSDSEGFSAGAAASTRSSGGRSAVVAGGGQPQPRRNLAGRGIGKRERRIGMRRNSRSSETSIRQQSKLFRRSSNPFAPLDVPRGNANAAHIDDSDGGGEVPVISYDAFVAVLDFVARAKMYVNVEGVSWAVAACMQMWRTMEFSNDILPLALHVLNERAHELRGLLPAVTLGLIVGLTRGVTSTLQLELLEAIYEYLKRDDGEDSDVTDGVCLCIASACIREVSMDALRIGSVLDRLVSLALGVLGTRSTFSRSAGAEFLHEVSSAVPMKRERVVTIVTERARLAIIELQGGEVAFVPDADQLPLPLYTLLGCTQTLVALVESSKVSLGLPFDTLEHVGETAMMLVYASSGAAYEQRVSDAVDAVCRRCGWSILAALLSYGMPQFFSWRRLGALVTLMREEFGDVSARKQLSAYSSSYAMQLSREQAALADAAQDGGAGGIGRWSLKRRRQRKATDAAAAAALAANGVEDPSAAAVIDDADGSLVVRGSENPSSTFTRKPTKRSSGAQASASLANTAAGGANERRRGKGQNEGSRSSGRISAVTSEDDRLSSVSSSSAFASDSESGRARGGGAFSRLAAPFAGFSRRRRRRSLANRQQRLLAREQGQMSVSDMFEDNFDLSRIERRLERAEKDSTYSGYASSRSGVVYVDGAGRAAAGGGGAGGGGAASAADHQSTARAAAMAALYELLVGNHASWLPQDVAEALVGLATHSIASLIANDYHKGVEKHVWSLEAWWALRCAQVCPPTRRFGEVSFHLAACVALAMQFEVVDGKDDKARALFMESALRDARERASSTPLASELRALFDLHGFNTPETASTASNTLQAACDALAALALAEDERGVALLDTIAEDARNYSSALAAYLCRSIAQRLSADDVGRHGRLLAHMQALMQRAALATSDGFDIRPADLYERHPAMNGTAAAFRRRGENGHEIESLNPTTFATATVAFRTLGRKCGEDFLLGLLRTALSLHDKGQASSVATLYLLGTLLQDSGELEGDVSAKSLQRLESALRGDSSAERVAAALSLSSDDMSLSVARRAPVLLDLMMSAIAEDSGRQYNAERHAYVYVPEGSLGDARLVLDNAGEIAAFGYGAEAIACACARHYVVLDETSRQLMEEIALELLSWDLLPSPATRETGLLLLSAMWECALNEAALAAGAAAAAAANGGAYNNVPQASLVEGTLSLNAFWSSKSAARRIGWAIYESLTVPSERRYSRLRDAAVRALAVLIRGAGAERVAMAFKDLPELLFVAIDDGCTAAAPVLLALVRADAPRRFGFWLDLCYKVFRGGPKLQDLDISERWDANVSRFGIKVVVGKFMEDTGEGLYGDEWDARALTRGFAVYIARNAVAIAATMPEQLERESKKKRRRRRRNQGDRKVRTLRASMKDTLNLAFDAASGASRNTLTITQGLLLLDVMIALNIERASFLEDFPSGKASRVLRRLLSSEVHPEVVAVATTVTGSILVTTSDTDLFDEGLESALLTNDTSSLHFTLVYSHAAEQHSTEAVYSSLRSLAFTVWCMLRQQKSKLLELLKGDLAILHRMFLAVSGDMATVIVDGGKSLSTRGSSLAVTAFEASVQHMYAEFGPRMVFTALYLLTSSTYEEKAAAPARGSDVEWFNSHAPGVALSRVRGSAAALPLVALCVWWLQYGRAQEEIERGPTLARTMFDECVYALKCAFASSSISLPASLMAEATAAAAVHNPAAAETLRNAPRGSVAPEVRDALATEDVLTALGYVTEGGDAQAMKWSLFTLKKALEQAKAAGTSSALHGRRVYAILCAVFALVDLTADESGQEEGVLVDKLPLNLDVAEIAELCVNTARGCGNDTDALVVARAMRSACEAARAGDVPSVQLALVVAMAGYRCAAALRKEKCSDYLLAGLERVLAVGDEAVCMAVLQSKEVEELLYDALEEIKQPLRSVRSAAGAWARLAVITSLEAGELSRHCERMLNTAMKRLGAHDEMVLESLASIVLSATRSSAQSRTDVYDLMSDSITALETAMGDEEDEGDLVGVQQPVADVQEADAGVEEAYERVEGDNVQVIDHYAATDEAEA